MATRAEQAQMAERRARPHEPKTKSKHAAEEARAMEEVKNATAGHLADGETARRNIMHDEDKNHATYALEDSANGVPSRKSTRRAANHIKPDSQLRRRVTRAVHSPQARAARAPAKGGANA